MHFKNSVKSTNFIVLLKAVKEVKSTASGVHYNVVVVVVVADSRTTTTTTS